ncbi:MAG: DMT family transporter [Alphaproteobacteria bacterium]|nr:DMT family transporter [Alphaproteobacteria bacterium]
MLTLIKQILFSAPILLALAALGWGGNTIAARLAVGELSPMLLVSTRWLMVAVLLMSIYPRSILEVLKTYKHRWLFFLAMGAGLSGFNIMFYLAAHSTTAINLGLMQSSIPAIIMLMGLIVFQTQATMLQIIGLVIAMTGAVIVIAKGSLETILTLTFNHGDLIMMVGCICYAGYTLGLSRRPAIDSITMMGVLSIFAFMTSLPFTIVESVAGAVILPSLTGWLILFYIAIVPSFLSQVWFMLGVDKIGSSKAGMFTNLVPVFSALLGIQLLGEQMGLYHLASLAMVFTGLYIAQRP